MAEPVFHLFLASCLLQGPPGSKGEKGERVSGSRCFRLPARPFRLPVCLEMKEHFNHSVCVTLDRHETSCPLEGAPPLLCCCPTLTQFPPPHPAVLQKLPVSVSPNMFRIYHQLAQALL